MRKNIHPLVVLFMALAACHQATPSGGTANGGTANGTAAQFATKTRLDIYGRREFTIDDEKLNPIAYYRSYSRNVQRLMQRADLESWKGYRECGSYIDTTQACNRAVRLEEQLEKLGWCSGSLDGIMADEHWMRCTDIPNYSNWPKEAFDEAQAAMDLAEAMPNGNEPRRCPSAEDWKAPVAPDIFGKPVKPSEYLQAYPISDYGAYPEPLQRKMQQMDIEVTRCWSSETERHRLQACNRRNRLMAEIEDRGWCYGNKDHIQTKPDWMKCSDIDGYAGNQPRADSALFGLADMRKAEAEESARCLEALGNSSNR